MVPQVQKSGTSSFPPDRQGGDGVTSGLSASCHGGSQSEDDLTVTVNRWRAVLRMSWKQKRLWQAEPSRDPRPSADRHRQVERKLAWLVFPNRGALMCSDPLTKLHWYMLCFSAVRYEHLTQLNRHLGSEEIGAVINPPDLLVRLFSQFVISLLLRCVDRFTLRFDPKQD